MSKISIFGERIAVKRTEQKFEGKIFLPPSRQKSYDIGEVIEAGSKSYLKPGDMVLFQIHDFVAVNSMIKVDKEPVIIFHQNDVIATVASKTLSWDVVTVTGKRLLLEPWIDKLSDIIITPDSVANESKELVRYKVTQLGAQVDIPVVVGQEVFPDRGKCFPLVIGSENRVYVDQECILGIRLE